MYKEKDRQRRYSPCTAARPRPTHRALKHLVPRQWRQDASDAEAPPLPDPKGLGFSPGTEEGEESTATPPIRQTTPKGVAVDGIGHHQSELSLGLLQPTMPHEAPISGHTRSSLPGAGERDARERRKGTATFRTDDRPPAQPSRRPPAIPPPERPGKAASTRARRPPPSRRRHHLPGPPPRLPKLPPRAPPEQRRRRRAPPTASNTSGPHAAGQSSRGEAAAAPRPQHNRSSPSWPRARALGPATCAAGHAAGGSAPPASTSPLRQPAPATKTAPPCPAANAPPPPMGRRREALPRPPSKTRGGPPPPPAPAAATARSRGRGGGGTGGMGSLRSRSGRERPGRIRFPSYLAYPNLKSIQFGEQI